MVLKIIGVILALIAIIEVAWLIKLLRAENDAEEKKHKAFVRFPGTGKEYLLNERTIHELQIAGVNIVVEPNR